MLSGQPVRSQRLQSPSRNTGAFIALQEFGVEVVEIVVDRLVGATAQKHRQPYFAAFELAFVEHSCAEKRGGRNRRGAFLGRSEGRCGARLVMVLEEAQQLGLIRRIGVQVKTNAFGILVFQAIVEPLVVTEVKSFLLQLPLQVPIGFGDEKEVRICFCLTAGIASTQYSVGGVAPARLPQVRSKIEFSSKHRHVAAHTVALTGNAG